MRISMYGFWKSHSYDGLFSISGKKQTCERRINFLRISLIWMALLNIRSIFFEGVLRECVYPTQHLRISKELFFRDGFTDVAVCISAIDNTLSMVVACVLWMNWQSIHIMRSNVKVRLTHLCKAGNVSYFMGSIISCEDVVSELIRSLF